MSRPVPANTIWRENQLFTDYEKRIVHARRGNGRKGRQDRRPAGRAGSESFRRDGSDGRETSGVAAGRPASRRVWIPKNWRGESVRHGRRLPEPRHAFSLEIITRTGLPFSSIWVRIRRGCGRRTSISCTRCGWNSQRAIRGSKLHHRDVVGVALRRMREQLTERRTRRSGPRYYRRDRTPQRTRAHSGKRKRYPTQGSIRYFGFDGFASIFLRS